MKWLKPLSYYLLLVVLFLFTYSFGVNKVSAFEVQGVLTYTSGTGTGKTYTTNDPYNLQFFSNNSYTLFKSFLGCVGEYPTCSTHLSNTAQETNTNGVLNNYALRNSSVVLYYGLYFSGTNYARLYGAGNFWSKTCTEPNLQGNCIYFKYSLDTGLVPSVDNATGETTITSFTYSTTTQTARVQGYWNATSTTGVTERLQFHQFSTLLGIESFRELIATSTGLFDLSFEYKALPTPYTSTTTPAFVADTVLFAEIYQYDNNYATDPFSGTFDSRYKTLLVATTTTITTLTGIQIATSTRDLFAYPEYECSITSITGCFKNALIWSFYPTEESIKSYYNFISLIQSKAPIGYFFVARDSIQGLNKDGTPTANVTIPLSIKNYIFSPFDLGISGILWLFFLFSFYKRLKTIQI